MGGKRKGAEERRGGENERNKSQEGGGNRISVSTQTEIVWKGIRAREHSLHFTRSLTYSDLALSQFRMVYSLL